MSHPQPVQQQKTFMGHPRALGTLFSLEMWERFSYYGMQAILAYYMYYSATQGGLGMDRSVAVSLVGAYGGSVYLCTILGAWLADRVLGSERVLFYSATMIMAGHIALAILNGGLGLTIGLILVAVGSGGLKANASSIVGTLYAEGDPKRDAGFSIFYMSINIGALAGPLLTGLLQTRMGFHYGFGAAAVGMALGLGIYFIGRKNIPAEANEVADPLHGKVLIHYAIGFLACIAIVAALFIGGIITPANLADSISYAVIAAIIIYFIVILRSKEVSSTERSRVYAFIPLFIASVAFWALFQQQFTFIAVYADEKLNRSLLGWEMPASWAQSINPVFIILFAGLFAAMWTKMGKKQPSTPVKFSLALMLIGLAFLAFIPLNTLEKTPLLAFIGIILLFTWAELLISPIGLSVTTKLAPKAFRTQMLALFFLSLSLGTIFAGIFAGYYQPGNEVRYFVSLGASCIVLGIILLLCTPWIKRMMQGVQ
ncbi:peptide MFS transporter [Cardiobacteriaceae bacterium TAE3-ERU3]|nr:peptide MFS transporter [Cardiobacteriaceae bacterium TAE3-ERU3]